MEYSKKTQWIPAMEKLPKSNHLVLVTIEGFASKYIDIGWFDEEEETWFINGYENENVSAWMPLPDPYKMWGKV